MSILNFFKGLFEKYLFKDTSSKNVFDHHFFDLKYYLHQDASIENFAFLLNFTSNKVTQIAATYYNCSFQVLLNEHRCMQVVLELNNPVNAGLSMESIVKLSGFKSSEQYSDYLKGNMNKIKSSIKILSIVLVMLVSVNKVQSQVSIGVPLPASSAMLDVSSTTKGFLPPRMSEIQRNIIIRPEAGLIVYQTDGKKGLYHYDGTAWTYMLNQSNNILANSILVGGGNAALTGIEPGSAGSVLMSDGTKWVSKQLTFSTATVGGLTGETDSIRSFGTVTPAAPTFITSDWLNVGGYAVYLKNKRKIYGNDFDGTAPLTMNLLSDGITSSGVPGRGFLTVSGNTTLNGLTNINNNATITGTLGVTAATTLNNTLTVAGITAINNNATITGTLAVGGASTLTGTLTVNNSATISSTLAVGGASTLTGTLTTKAGISNTGTITNTGSLINTGSLTNNGNATITGTLGVTGATTLNGGLTNNGNATITGTLAVGGATTLNSTLAVNSATTLSSTLTTAGLTTLNGGLTNNGRLTNIGNATITGTLLVSTVSPTSTAAVLELSSTTQGFLPPRMTTLDRNAITNKVEGLTIWNTDNKQLEVYDGSYWVNMNGKLVSTLIIGDSYGGGKVAYIFTANDPGYISGQTHGLIAASADQTTVSTTVKWFPDKFYGATGTNLGLGLPNTISIIAAAIALGTTNLSTFAAGLANNCRDGGYSDWYLPSKDELDKLYQNKSVIGGFATSGDAAYWSSSQKGYMSFTSFSEFTKGVSSAWLQLFSNSGSDAAGLQKDLGISNTRRVRAVRMF